MSLDNIQGKLSRAEMKNIMAGRVEEEGGGGGYCGNSNYGNATNCPPHTTAEYCNAQKQGICKDSNGTCYVMGVAGCDS